MKETGLPETASPDAIAALVGLTGRRVRQVLSAAKVAPVSRGKVPLGPALVALMDAAKGERSATPEALARAELTKARAAEIKLRTAERRRDLIPYCEAEAALDRIVGQFVSELVGLPAQVTRDLRLRRQVDDAARAMRTRLAERFAGEAERLRKGDLA